MTRAGVKGLRVGAQVEVGMVAGRLGVRTGDRLSPLAVRQPIEQLGRHWLRDRHAALAAPPVNGLEVEQAVAPREVE